MPDGLWTVYSTEEECCSTSFPSSTTCYIELETKPTKHPTISLEDDDGQDIVPIQFIVMGVPEDASINELKEGMLESLKGILLDLSQSIGELTVTNVEEKIMGRRSRRNNLEEAVERKSRHNSNRRNHSNRRPRRGLEETVEVVFDVTVVHHEDIRFGPIIIEAIRNSYDEIISDIQ